MQWNIWIRDCCRKNWESRIKKNFNSHFLISKQFLRSNFQFLNVWKLGIWKLEIVWKLKNRNFIPFLLSHEKITPSDLRRRIDCLDVMCNNHDRSYPKYSSSASSFSADNFSASTFPTQSVYYGSKTLSWRKRCRQNRTKLRIRSMPWRRPNRLYNNLHLPCMIQARRRNVQSNMLL
jgi:hypothetical protein